MIVDTSALLACFDESEEAHEAVCAAIAGADRCVVSPYVLAELDYLVTTNHGRPAQLTVLSELLENDWELASLSPEEVAATVDLVDSAGQTLSVADASNVVLARRDPQAVIVTLDQQRFSSLHDPDRPPLTVVP